MALDAVLTPEFRANFVFLNEPFKRKPKAGEEAKRPRYECNMIFGPSTDLSVLKAAAQAAAVAQWGEKIPKKLRSPFINADDLENLEGVVEAGSIVLRPWSYQKPALVRRNAQGAIEDMIDPEDFFSGCYGFAKVQPYAYTKDKTDQDGVGFMLGNVMMSREGERIGGGFKRADPADDFAPVTTGKPAAAASNGVFG